MHRLQFSWPIQISDFLWRCGLPIPIFADSDFLSKNYNWQHIQKISMQISMKKYLQNKITY